MILSNELRRVALFFNGYFFSGKFVDGDCNDILCLNKEPVLDVKGRTGKVVELFALFIQAHQCQTVGLCPFFDLLPSRPTGSVQWLFFSGRFFDFPYKIHIGAFDLAIFRIFVGNETPVPRKNP